MNGAARWKAFIEWWSMADFIDLDAKEVIDLVQAKVDEIKRGCK